MQEDDRTGSLPCSPATPLAICVELLGGCTVICLEGALRGGAEMRAFIHGVETPIALTKLLEGSCCPMVRTGGELPPERPDHRDGPRSLLLGSTVGLLLRCLCVLSVSKAPIQTGSDALSHVRAGSDTEAVLWLAEVVVTDGAPLHTGLPGGVTRLPPNPIVRVIDADRAVRTGAVKEDPADRGTGAVEEPD